MILSQLGIFGWSERVEPVAPVCDGHQVPWSQEVPPACMDLSGARGSRRQAGVSEFAGLCGPDLAGEDGDDSKGVAVERRELDFVALGVLMDKDDRADVAGLEAFFGQVCGEDHAVQFAYHLGDLLTGRHPTCVEASSVEDMP